MWSWAGGCLCCWDLSALIPHCLLGSCPFSFVSQGVCLVAVTPEGRGNFQVWGECIFSWFWCFLKWRPNL